MTNQQVFDKAVTGILIQGCPSIDGEGAGAACRYRLNKAGQLLKCVVGHLIPDSCYSRDLEGRIARDIKHLLNDLGVDPELAQALQDLHDGYMAELKKGTSFIPYFIDGAREIATRFKLNTRAIMIHAPLPTTVSTLQYL